MVVPRFVSQALARQPLTVYGDGSQTRCFLHVADAVEAIVALAGSPRAVGEVFNVGSTEEVSIFELAKKVLALVDARRVDGVGDSGGITLVPYEQAYEAGFEDMQRRVPDVSKIHSHIGWEPSRSLDETLEDIVSHLAVST
jgi:UDP-glucose 4-epimerase